MLAQGPGQVNGAGRVSGVNGGLAAEFKEGPPYLIDLPEEVQAKGSGGRKKDMF